MAIRNVSVLILYVPAGKVLLQHRTKDAPRFPDYWAFFGGGIEQGETPEVALKREALEELSYEVQHVFLLAQQEVKYKEEESIKYIFVEEYKDQPLQLGEGQAMGWFTPEETKALKMTDHDRAIIQQVQHYLEQKAGSKRVI